MGWFFLGVLVNVLAILFVAIAPQNKEVLGERGIEHGTRKTCPECAEVVKVKGKKMPILPFNTGSGRTSTDTKRHRNSNLTALLLSRI